MLDSRGAVRGPSPTAWWASRGRGGPTRTRCSPSSLTLLVRLSLPFGSLSRPGSAPTRSPTTHVSDLVGAPRCDGGRTVGVDADACVRVDVDVDGTAARYQPALGWNTWCTLSDCHNGKQPPTHTHTHTHTVTKGRHANPATLPSSCHTRIHRRSNPPHPTPPERTFFFPLFFGPDFLGLMVNRHTTQHIHTRSIPCPMPHAPPTTTHHAGRTPSPRLTRS